MGGKKNQQLEFIEVEYTALQFYIKIYTEIWSPFHASVVGNPCKLEKY
jgi:hypothetical protein